MVTAAVAGAARAVTTKPAIGILAGTSNADTMRGYDGNDSLKGLAGADKLYGGGGATEAGQSRNALVSSSPAYAPSSGAEGNGRLAAV